MSEQKSIKLLALYFIFIFFSSPCVFSLSLDKKEEEFTHHLSINVDFGARFMTERLIFFTLTLVCDVNLKS